VGGVIDQCCWAVVQTHTLTNLSRAHSQFILSLRRGSGDSLLLPVVAELDGRAVKDTAECDGLNLPVRHGVAEQADARVHGLLGVEARGAEVLCSHSGDLVGMEVNHLYVFVVRQTRRYTGQGVVVHVQLSEVRNVGQ